MRRGDEDDPFHKRKRREKYPAAQLVAIFGLREIPEIRPSYNIAPTQQVAVIRQVSDHNSINLMKWGLVPSWAKDPAIGSQMITTKYDSVSE